MISDIVGFKDQRYFSQIFKKILNYTPNEFRKMIGGKKNYTIKELWKEKMKILKNRLIKKHIGFRYQLVLSFGILIILVGISITLGLSYCFTETYKHSAVKYIEDISRQTVHNMDIKIQRIEQISREILSNSIVQSDLRRVNTDTLTAYQTNLIRSEIRTELSSKTLFEDNISEISVQALNGERFQTSKILNHLETNAFSEREIRRTS